MLLFLAAYVSQAKAALRRGRQAKNQEVKRELATGNRQELFMDDTTFWSRYIQEDSSSVVLCSGEVGYRWVLYTHNSRELVHLGPDQYIFKRFSVEY